MIYESDIVIGERYVDDQTQIEGVATAVYFFQHACERVQLEYVNQKDGNLTELVFDAPRLRHAVTRTKVESDRPGGPARNLEGQRPGQNVHR